ncbi:hypothetical protein GCM10009410_08960 [Shewanella ulleungensis]|uniref:Uncharacterized protein n=1 Tax=Shewanella ulleungensis TaxID=2282699 RepID=A0ABQ2QFD9_9GAMM|nr:hypothetical protein GCM10009410_08960 [Shewanella ulleungensis]
MRLHNLSAKVRLVIIHNYKLLIYKVLYINAFYNTTLRIKLLDLKVENVNRWLFYKTNGYFIYGYGNKMH